eukprot:5406861-Amphidinium_carterae.1
MCAWGNSVHENVFVHVGVENERYVLSGVEKAVVVCRPEHHLKLRHKVYDLEHSNKSRMQEGPLPSQPPKKSHTNKVTRHKLRTPRNTPKNSNQ